MENLAVSSQLFTQTATPSSTEPGTSAAGAAADFTTLGQFGALLAKQIALGASQDVASIDAALHKGGSKDDAKGDIQAGVVDMLAQGLVEPSVMSVPSMPPVAVNMQSVDTSEVSASVDTVTLAGGKSLPAPAAVAADVAAAAVQPDQLEAAIAAVSDHKTDFAQLLSEKKTQPLQEAALQAGALQQLQPGAVTAEKAAQPAQAVLSVPQQVGAENWGTGLGDKVVWMVGNQTRGAEIHLNPPALGPMEIRISVSDGQANLSFMAHHASVREAIEAATPRLREMLGDSGINMGSVSVNVGSFAQQQQQAANQQQSGSPWRNVPEGAFADETLNTFVQPLRQSGRGVVDFFA